jgi:hypothetical protein
MAREQRQRWQQGKFKEKHRNKPDYFHGLVNERIG